MRRAQRIVSHAAVPLLSLAASLVATGCLGDLFHVSGSLGDARGARAARGGVAGLWELAPADATAGVVVHDGALVRALALMADPDRSPGRASFEEVAQKRSGLPFDPLSAEEWAGAGLDPSKGAAMFTFADRKRGAVMVLPVVDRTLFRRAFGLVTRVVGGREIDVLDDDTQCEPAAGRYVCAHSLDAIAAAATPHPSPLAASALEVDEHGEVEMYVSRDAPSIAHSNHEKDSPGWITAVTGALRLRADGATLHLHASGSLATPAARGYLAGLPPPELVAAAKGATTVARIHVDPAAVFRPSAEIEPEMRTELVEQLTGDVEMIPTGTGFANVTMVLPVHDAARVEAFVKKRCAEEAAKKERRPLGGFKVEGHGCAAVIDTTKLLVPVRFPEVPVAATVADERLVITLGDVGKGPAGPPRGATPVDGEGAEHALEDAETLLFFAHDLGIGPDVAPGALFRAAIPLFGERVASAIEAWSYASAHLSQAFVRARVTDEGADFTMDLTSFAADPPAAREAYAAALGRRFAGDDASYRAALVEIERRFPGTRAAGRAAEVRRGAPFFGAGVALLGTLALTGNTGGKKK